MPSLNWYQDAHGMYHLCTSGFKLQTTFQGIFDRQSKVWGLSCYSPSNLLPLIEQYALFVHLRNFSKMRQFYPQSNLLVEISPNAALRVLQQRKFRGAYHHCIAQFLAGSDKLLLTLGGQDCEDEDRLRDLISKQAGLFKFNSLAIENFNDRILGRVLALMPKTVTVDCSFLYDPFKADWMKCIQQWRNAGIMVIATGIKNKEEFDKMTLLGCHRFKGDYLSAPFLWPKENKELCPN